MRPSSSITSPRLTPMRKLMRRFSGSAQLHSPSCTCIAAAASTASTALANSASTLSPGMSTTRPRCFVTTSVTRPRQVVSVRTVAASSSPIRRLKPATSALRIAASLRGTRVAYRSAEEHEAEHDLYHGERLAHPAFAPSAGYAFGEVGKDQHARPLVGVAFSPHDSRERQRQRQRFKREQRASRPQRGEPQLPGEAKQDERDQRAAGKKQRYLASCNAISARRLPCAMHSVRSASVTGWSSAMPATWVAP